MEAMEENPLFFPKSQMLGFLFQPLALARG